MKRPKIPKTKKPYIFGAIAIVLVFVLYFFFAYNYFYYRLHHVKINWPDNNHSYSFNEKAKDQKTYVALGDSLTYGFGADNYQDSWTYRTAQYLSVGGQGIKLKDFSYPGYRVDNVSESLGPAIATKPDIVTLFVGVNDVHKLVPTADFKQKYDNILYRLTHETKARIYVINLPYLGGPTVLLPPYNYYFDMSTKRFNTDIKNLAEKYGATYVDLYSATSAQFKKSGPYYAKDLYHPSAEGYKIWADIIDNAIHN